MKAFAIAWSILFALIIIGGLGVATWVYAPVYVLLVPYMVFVRLIKSSSPEMRLLWNVLLGLVMCLMLLTLVLAALSIFAPNLAPYAWLNRTFRL